MVDAQHPRESANDRAKLGDRLRLARESRGITTELASEQAAVPIRYIRMFEEGRYPVVADPAYLTHFVRRYASYLGMDAWQASRDFIAETEPETALRRAGKLAGEPPLEATMTNSKTNPPPDKSKSAKTAAGSTDSAPSTGHRPRFDAGPISLIGAAVTLGLFLLNVYLQQKRPQHTAPIVEGEKSTSTQASAPAPASAPQSTSASAPASEPAQPAAAPPEEKAPAAEAPPPPPPAAPEARAPEAPAAQPAAPSQATGGAGSASESSASSATVSAAPSGSVPQPAAPRAEVETTKRSAPSAAPSTGSGQAAMGSAPKMEPAPNAEAAPKTAAATAAGGAEGGHKPKPNVDATNKASEQLRAEQLERMKARNAGGGAQAPAAGGAQAPAAQ